MYIYFDTNGTIKEVINDESIRRGSSDYNKIYCYLEGNPDIDDIWYLQKNPDGTLTNEVSFVDNIVTKAIPYDAKRDMKYFQDFEEYQFYVFTLSSSYLSQNGLVVATIRVAENNTLWALGELTFNVQANIVNSDNDITQSQYDYLLLTISSYYSKAEIDAKLDLKADKSTTYTKTETDAIFSNVYSKTASDSRFALKQDTYTKLEVNEVALDLMNDIDGINNQLGGLETRTTELENDVADLKSVQNVVDIVATYSALQSYNTSHLDVDDKVQVIADETHNGASTIYNWDGSVWQYVGAYGTNSYTKQETLEQIDLHKLVNKTYSELATLKTNNGLVAGQMYRITDYVTTTNGKCNGIDNDVRSVEHPFDVIVTAISNNEFSENARAIQHTGDSYFANSKLEAWRLWYSFDNDTNRFEWADTTNGKGVIYRMIDEFQNDVPYDFKNIQFKRYIITGVTDQRQSTLVGEYLGFYENYNVTSDSTDYVWKFTFSKRADNSDLSLIEVNNSTFTSNAYVKQVVMGEYITDNPTYRCKQALNNIVMEVEALIVDVEMGKGSHHNTWFGNEDIDYCYFASMFRNNILFGEINHTRADECFEKNVIGDGAFTTYASCWNKFTHHFSRNIGINMQSNDFEGQVDETKFPLHFTRNHISNMWDEVNASSHTTFNRCEFGYVVTATFGGTGTWDGVKSIMLWNTTININNFFGATIGRLEYVTISQGANSYSILNLTTGALNGSPGKPLTINLSDISNLLPSYYEKNITFAWHNLLNAKCLVYSVKVYDKTNNLVYDTTYAGIINTANNNVTWEEVGNIGQLKALVNTKADTSYVDGKLEEVGEMFEIVGNEVLKKANAEYLCKGTSLTQTSYSNTNPSKSTKVVLSKVGGMSYKVNDTIQNSAITQINSKNGSTIVNSLSIPSNVQNLTGYGWGINDTCYNYIDFEDKKFVQNVGTRAYQSGDETDTSVITDGTTTYYELATPIETDISSYITKDTLEVVEGGTLEFLNTYSQAVPNEVAYLFNAVTLNNIVDSKGNPRFVEGEGTPATITGFTATQCKWSLSGTHLMLVLAGSVANGTTINDGVILATFNLPDFIFNKIATVWANLYIEMKQVSMYSSSWTTQALMTTMRKSSVLQIIKSGGSTSLTDNRNFRLQFDILIDSE